MPNRRRALSSGGAVMQLVQPGAAASTAAQSTATGSTVRGSDGGDVYESRMASTDPSPFAVARRHAEAATGVAMRD